MSLLKLYHGSHFIIRQPLFGMGNPKNDYGRGFYCTETLDLAKEWACSDQNSGFANAYELEWKGMKVLKLTGKGYHILNWLAILLENRTFDLNAPLARQGRQYILDHFLPDYKDMDILIGYRADDSYFSFTRDFLNNTISLSQLSAAMRLGKLGEQVVLKSPEAFEALRFVEAIPAEKEIWYPLKAARDHRARNSYFMNRQTSPDGVYLIDIIRQQWENDDERL